VLNETPATAIIEEAQRSDTRLIALASHGLSGFDRLRFGSVTETVLSESDVPVLVAGTEVPGDVPDKITNILVPVDLSDESLPALRFAAQLASLTRASLTVLHVAANDRAESDDKLVDWCNEWLPEDITSTCNVGKMVRRGEVTEAILDATDKEPVDLLVLGSERHTFGDEAFGTKTRDIIRASRCPVVIVPRIKSPQPETARP
jgi:nucleotide-binding universal stress UspA family protein